MVYLICFEKPFKHARHYIGFAETMDSFEKRIACHRKGRGAKLLDHVTKAGINFEVVRTWPDGDRNFERKLKNRKKSSDLCPHCKAAKAEARKKFKAVAVIDIETGPLNGKFDLKSVCPVIEYHKTTHNKPYPHDTVKAIEVLNAESKNDANPRGWQRVWSILAGLRRFLSIERFSKRQTSRL